MALKFSGLVDRVGGESAAAWDIHSTGENALRQGEDVILMSIGDSDFATPEPITDAARRALEDGDTHYTEVAGRADLRRALAQRHFERTGIETGIENVIVMAGAQSALFAASLCLVGERDQVIGLEPMYVTYEATLRAGGAELVRVSQPEAAGFRPNPSSIEAAVTARTRAIFITNPNHPTGVVMTETELAGIAGIASRNDLWVVSDEVYADLVFEGAHRSIAALPGLAERTVTVGSFSKSHAMTGWRLGWAIGPAPLIRHLENLSQCMLYGLPGFIQAAGSWALTSETEYSQEIREIYRRRRDLAYRRLSAIDGLVCTSPEAGMFLMVDVRSLDLSGYAFASALYQEESVTVLDAAAFGRSAEGYVRVSFAIGEERIIEGCDRIARFVAGRQATAAE